jgi:dihydrofolate synthase/folylpolyglutamate synthase
MPRFTTLNDWLGWQDTLHPRKIDLGLERVARVASELKLDKPGHGVVTVAGTNGKGSSVAMLDCILRAAGYRTGSYTSPHLQRYNERIQIDGAAVDDKSLCAAFQAVDEARGDITLSYFEFGTLAALTIFKQASLDMALLEVGMGGRLDAVNIMQPDVALVTSIGIDHSAWLGTDREQIGREKAGIFRAGRPAVCSDPAPPASLERIAAELGALWLCLGEAYTYDVSGHSWSWRGAGQSRKDLPLPNLAGSHQLDNAAGVLMVIESLNERYPVSREAIEKGLQSVSLPGRCQIIPGAIETVLDVAHNADSAERLLRLLRAQPVKGRTWMILGMLDDKDVGEFTGILGPEVDHWQLASLETGRGLSATDLQDQIQPPARGKRIQCFPDVATALRQTKSEAMAGDRIVVSGSFFTVAEAMACHV